MFPRAVQVALITSCTFITCSSSAENSSASNETTFGDRNVTVTAWDPGFKAVISDQDLHQGLR